jgi:hypothetical protein
MNSPAALIASSVQRSDPAVAVCHGGPLSSRPLGKVDVLDIEASAAIGSRKRCRLGLGVVLLSAAKAKRLEDDGKGGRMLPAAWVIEMVAGERLAPIVQHPYQLPFRDLSFHEVLGQVSQP